MKRVAIVVVFLAGVVVAVVAAAVLAGVIPFANSGDSGRPPCAELPTKQAVNTALDRHQDLAGRLRTVGKGVSVTVATPCDNPDLALVSVRYGTAEERSRIEDILNNNDGFGVPVEVVKAR